ncbi:MAG: deoxyribodipyrimidine photo-lyase [Hyphomicrobiaceae bacterium]|nr:deoxyribodipyrimidine photo-lyase [Hyphomicrobiaceae bacterium]
MTDAPVVLWFRNDLRLADHRALKAAVASGRPIVPVFVLDDISAGPWAAGGAARWWLHHSLEALAASIEERGGRLVFRRGEAAQVLASLAEDVGATACYFSRRYEPWAIRQEKAVKDRAEKGGIEVRRFAGSLLMEPERVATQAGDPYKVYTPFWRQIASVYKPERPLKAPETLNGPKSQPRSDRLEDWSLLPRRPDWARGFADVWTPGEAGAVERLDDFLENSVAGYTEERNRPDLASTSRLSPHLAHGEISPGQIWWRTASARAAASSGSMAGPGDKGYETFLKELVWREFSAHLLFHFPTFPDEPFRAEFSRFPWSEDEAGLVAWQRGNTGFPIVDAGLRELWATGWMHNRVRMIVASFLIKDLLIPWQSGEAWFWDTLVDADLANNSASWQWVAGSGADAAPYFRIFNPTTQGQKFDPDGVYVRQWVPELAQLPDKFVHDPSAAPPETLASAGVELGATYPAPMVDHKVARVRALDAFERLKK